MTSPQELSDVNVFIEFIRLTRSAQDYGHPLYKSQKEFVDLYNESRNRRLSVDPVKWDKTSNLLKELLANLKTVQHGVPGEDLQIGVIVVEPLESDIQLLIEVQYTIEVIFNQVYGTIVDSLYWEYSTSFPTYCTRFYTKDNVQIMYLYSYCLFFVIQVWFLLLLLICNRGCGDGYHAVVEGSGDNSHEVCYSDTDPTETRRMLYSQQCLGDVALGWSVFFFATQILPHLLLLVWVVIFVVYKNSPIWATNNFACVKRRRLKIKLDQLLHRSQEIQDRITVALDLGGLGEYIMTNTLRYVKEKWQLHPES